MKRTRAGIATLAILGAVAASTPASAQAPGKKPNILVIFGDDIGVSKSAPIPTGSWGTARPTSTGSPGKA
jgi:hypothetical protein